MAEKVKDDEILFKFTMEPGLEPYISELLVQLPEDNALSLESDEEVFEVRALLESDEIEFFAKLPSEDREIMRRIADRIFSASSSVLNLE